jgi:outer membrane protein
MFFPETAMFFHIFRQSSSFPELTMRLIRNIGVALLVLQSGFLFSQTKTLTLDQARQIALERNISVAQAAYNVDAAQSGVLAAYGSYLPSLSGSAGWSRSQNDRPGSEPVYVNGIPVVAGSSGRSVANQYSAGLSASYTIFNGFSREGQFTRASSTAVAAEQTSARTRQSVVFQVESSYLNVLRNEQLVKVDEENLKRDRQQLDRITESNRVGALSIADVYRQQSQVAADELVLITAQNDYDKSKTDLLDLVGLNVNEDYTIADATISTQITKEEMDTTFAKYQNFADLSRRAISARPDYLSANEQLTASDAGVRVARSNYFPSIAAFAGYGIASPQFETVTQYRNLNWGVQLRWDLFDGFQTNQALQSAIAAQRSAQISLVQTERNVNVDIKKALLDLEAARKQYEVSQKGLVSANEDRKIAEERYNLGAGTLLDLLTANASYVNAQANQVNASYNYITAKRNVEYALGEKVY